MDPLSAGMSLLSSGLNYFGQQQTNEMQQQMQQQQQQFQERMSSTAYQRASTDMQAAGLNPMMMFSSGSAASTPSGSPPSGQVQSPFGKINLGDIVSSATQKKVQDATIDNLVAENARIKANTLVQGSTQLNQLAHAANTDADTDNKRVQRGILTSQGVIARNSAKTAENEMSMNPDARRLLDIGSRAGKGLADVISPIGESVWTAKGVKSLLPKNKSGSMTTYDKFGNESGGRSFDERWN